MKKIGFLFATIIMMMLFAVSASALDASGSLGDNVTYTYDSTTGEVVITIIMVRCFIIATSNLLL